MTIKVLPRPLRRVPPARPGRRPHIPLPPFPILVAEPPLKLPHPFITDATVIHTTTRVSLQQLPLSILTQHLQPPPMHSPPTRSRGLTRALRPQSGPRKTLSPQATFITTVSLRLVRLFRPLRFILMRPLRPSQRLPTLANRPLPGSVKFQPGPLQQLATTVAFIALILPHLPFGSHVRPLRPLLVPILPIRHSRPMPESARLQPGLIRRLATTVALITRISPRPSYGSLVRLPQPLLVPMLSIRRHRRPMPESARLQSGPLQWLTTTTCGRVPIPTYAHLPLMRLALVSPD